MMKNEAAIKFIIDRMKLNNISELPGSIRNFRGGTVFTILEPEIEEIFSNDDSYISDFDILVKKFGYKDSLIKLFGNFEINSITSYKFSFLDLNLVVIAHRNNL